MQGRKLNSIASILIIGVLLVALAIYLNRPQLTVVDANLPQGFPEQGFSHLSFENLLREYVDPEGLVDYERWHKSAEDRKALDSYLAAVSTFSPDATPERFRKRSDALAYWLYAYNAYVIRSILGHWPLESVTDVKAPLEAVKGLGFFYRQRFLFGGVAYSLYAVENDIVRKQYKDPRIHFVLNCASASCPVLKPDLPTGDDLEKLMHDATLEFVSDQRNVRIDSENRQVIVSTIFKWYEKDFINEMRRRGKPTDRGVLDYIASVGPAQLRDDLAAAKSYETVFADYDWALNSQQ
jgi:hypothetical protein